MLITAAALLSLNIYSANTTREMVFRSKDASMQSKVQLVVSSMSGLEHLNPDNVTQVITLLGDLGADRVVVTDQEGRALYDSLTNDNATGRIILLSEIFEALTGNDVFYSFYRTGALESRACMPVVSRDRTIGAIYLMEYDTGQGAIIAALETNLIRISLVLGAVVLLFSLIFALAFSRRVRLILQSIQLLREGEYSHKIKIRGQDEVSVLAEEFNKLTDRLRVSEESRRQFVSDASHELKTPLASIKLLSEDDIYQIAFNLVENGIKYNIDGGRLDVTLRREGDDVVLIVEDTGIGIPEEARERILERFYRVDKARSRQAGGSGLGLSIVHDLVERNYGIVSAEPRAEGGSRFTVAFPYFGLEDEE